MGPHGTRVAVSPPPGSEQIWRWLSPLWVGRRSPGPAASSHGKERSHARCAGAASSDRPSSWSRQHWCWRRSPRESQLIRTRSARRRRPSSTRHASASARDRCDLAFRDPALFDEPSAIIYDGIEILFSQTRSVVGKRFYDADGDLLKRHFREDLAGTYCRPVDRRGHRLGDARDQHPRAVDPGRPRERRLGRCQVGALVRARWRHGPGRRRSTGVWRRPASSSRTVRIISTTTSSEVT